MRSWRGRRNWVYICFWCRGSFPQHRPHSSFLPIAKAVSPNLGICFDVHGHSLSEVVERKVTFPTKYHSNIIYKILIKREFYYKIWRGRPHRDVQIGTKPIFFLLVIAKESPMSLPPATVMCLKRRPQLVLLMVKWLLTLELSTPVIPIAILFKLTFMASIELENCH